MKEARMRAWAAVLVAALFAGCTTSTLPQKKGTMPDLGKQGSYPSGHSAAGWAWALVLAEVAPVRAEAILERAAALAATP
jgi:membrane-associated phospholipid phosphatase